MSPSPKAATELKKLQSSLYTYLATILRVQKIYIRGYHDMLAGLAQCLAYQKSATEPTHVRNLQLMQTHYTIVMKELEDKMADSMQTVRVLRNASEFLELIDLLWGKGWGLMMATRRGR